ncbi:MAG: FAD-binding monooxygenase, partial [Limnohabitans sp.]|nr:FAD-binding monooxygenase [Limnohabitans sp.]
VLGVGWRLLFSDDAPPAWIEQAQQWSRPGLCMAQLGHHDFQEVEGVLQAWFKRHHCQVALVRPDHYVYGVASTWPEMARQLNELANL